MAHRLSPKPGQRYLSPREIVRCLRGEFAIVEADRDAGADHVGDMIAQFLRMQAPPEIIEAHRKAQPESIRVLIADDSPGEVYLSFVAMPEAGLFISYHSREHEQAAAALLHRCADTLGYDIELI